MGYDDRKKFWFGTEGYSKWMVTPNSGANMGPSAWNEGGGFLSGGGFQRNSFGSHREYVLEWSGSSTYEAAQEMLDFYNGSYGDGLIHFVLPTIYDKNILPSQWASPSTLEGPTSLVPGVVPTIIRDTGVKTLLAGSTFPRAGVLYTIEESGEPGKSLFVPIPEGFDLVLGFTGAAANADAGVFATPVASVTGAAEAPIRIRPALNTPASETPVVTDVVSGAGRAGVRLWIGKTAGESSLVQVIALCARLVPSGSMVSIPDLDVPFDQFPAIARKPWVGGMGHSGCRFESPPTTVLNTGINGGTASYAANFREIGTWLR